MLASTMAVIIGAAIPAIVIGRGAMGALMICGLLIAVALRHRDLVCPLRGLAFKPITLLIAATALLWLPSVIQSLNPIGSLVVLTRMLIFLAGAFILYDAFREDEARYLALLKSFVVSSFLLYLIAVGLLMVRQMHDMELIENIEWANSFLSLIRGNGWINDDYNVRLHLKESTSSALLLIPLVIWAAYQLRGRWIFLCVLLLAELAASIWLADNRSSMAGVVAIVLTAGFLFAIKNRTVHAAGLSALVLIAIISGVMGWLLLIAPSYTGLPANEEFFFPLWLVDPPRQVIWAFAMKAGEAPQWFGVGINMIDKLPGASDWNQVSGTRNIPLHPHNWIIEVMIETGAIGIIALVVTIIFSAFSISREFLKTGHWAFLAALCVSAGYWTNGLFSVSYWSAWWQISFFVATAICLAGAPRRDPCHTP